MATVHWVQFFPSVKYQFGVNYHFKPKVLTPPVVVAQSGQHYFFLEEALSLNGAVFSSCQQFFPR